MELFNLISLAVIFGVAMLLLYRQGIFRDKALLVCALVLTAAAMLIRGFYFDVQSDDYTTFLAPWTQFFRDNGGFKALAFFPGNYNPPYMYFLAAFSYFGISELYLIKLLSVLFDVLLAYGCMKLLSLYTGSKAKQLGVFLAVLYLPTVVTNGAYWAQCDSIYAFFGIFALYLGLACRLPCVQAAGRVHYPCVFRSAACQKATLDTASRLPCRVYRFHAARRHCRSAAVGYTDAVFFAGRYCRRRDELQRTVAHQHVLVVGRHDAGRKGAYHRRIFARCGGLLLRKKLSDRVILGFAIILAMGIPYLLPHMHDRYFFIPGVLALVLAASDLHFAPVPIFAELASLHCYYAYFNRYYLVQPRIGGELMLAALLLCIAYTVVYVRKARNFEISP